MKFKNYILILIVLLLLFFVSSCSFKESKKELKQNTEDLGTQVNIPNIENKFNNISFEFLDKSGPITNLPWDNDTQFIEAQKKNNTNILLAAYCTILKDPLPGEEYNVHLAADSLAGMIVLPEQIFSQNNSIGPYVESKGYKKGPTYIGSKVTTTVGGGVCKIASTLYNVSILSNLKIIERHNHGMPVPYVPYGQDATVAYGVKDFRFKNNTDSPILIWAKGIENRLYIGFYSNKTPPKVEWYHNILETRQAPKEYKINPDLEDGTEKIIIEGMDGAKVESYVTIEYPDGTVERKDLGISSYKPMPYLIEVKR